MYMCMSYRIHIPCPTKMIQNHQLITMKSPDAVLGSPNDGDDLHSLPCDGAAEVCWYPHLLVQCTYNETWMDGWMDGDKIR